jgi:soluble lytic murein transglycosylase-like protein
MRFLLGCLCALPALAGEYAILSNGFRLHAERHETAAGMVRLYTDKGLTELPESSIAGFEKEEYVPPPPAPAASAKPVESNTAQTPRELVDHAASKAGLPPELVHSVAKAESGYNVAAVSTKGAIGLMQLMPGTAAELNADPRNPQQNADAGAKYLADLLVKYGGDVAKAVAAYNAGPSAVDKYNGVPPYPETRTYVNRVIRNYKQLGGE